MVNINRRNFLKYSIATGAGLALAGCENMPEQQNTPMSSHHAKGRRKVVIIGGGVGGATVAKYIRKSDPSIKITLIEPKISYTTCFGSNWVIAGLYQFEHLEHSYRDLREKYGIEILHDTVIHIDAEKRKIITKDGRNLYYERVVVSPGIDFHWNEIEGYTEQVSYEFPHAWQAGAQTKLLIRQLHAMPNGGTVIIAPPRNPFRCPPGPYERASMIAHYLKQHKPRSKILIFDPKDTFSKRTLFIQGWEENYGYGTDNAMIEWVSASDDGKVLQFDPINKTVYAEFGKQKADVVNIIPAQKAGKIAQTSGLTDDSGWCPVDHRTWESTLIPNVHVIGDASIAGHLPKSGYAANSEAKVCALAIIALMNGKPIRVPSWINTCYSLVTPTYGISVAMVYKLNAKNQVARVDGAGGISQSKYDGITGNKLAESIYAKNWYKNITSDIFH